MSARPDGTKIGQAATGGQGQDLGPGAAAAGAKPPPGKGPSLPFCGDFAIRIARDGTWFYQGTPIGRKPLVKLFASVLRREADGDYWLVTPFERGRIVVEDAPFVAVECDVEGSGEGQRLVFRTNIDELVTAGPEHPVRVAERPAAAGRPAEPSPYVLVRPGLEALIARPVFYQLVERAVPDPADPAALGLWSAGRFFRLGRLA
jgi:hypothetical protein